ncbi:MAG: hypothetical protein ACLFP2_02785 [Candidatus Woesearchaeota archaeon]
MISVHEDTAQLSINPRIYPLDTIYSASYVLLDEAYILLDGDPDTEVKVSIKPKSGQDPEELGYRFHNQLINYAVYKEQVKKNQDIRKVILQRALLTNGYKAEDEDLIPWEDYEDEDKD